MRSLQEGMTALMAAFGHEDVAICFRTSKTIVHHLHVNAVPMSNYTSKEGDWQMDDVIYAIELGTMTPPERSPERERAAKQGRHGAHCEDGRSSQ